MSNTIRVYGADWCGDCHRAVAALKRLAVSYEWFDIEHNEEHKQQAIEISGQQHIPVVLYPDDSFQVEPTANDITLKLRELGLI